MQAVVAGGTGLVGGALLDELAKRNVGTLALSRRVGDPRKGVLWRCIDMAGLRSEQVPPKATAAFCALGTTIKDVGGSHEEFRRVDHSMVLAFARACRAAGIPNFVVVSAAGADPGSRIFYSQVKGEAERDLRALGFPSLTILRPGLLLGDRRQKRPLERALIVGTRLLRPLLPGTAAGAKSTEVAKAMVACANEGRAGVRIVDNREIRRLARMA